MHVPDEKTTHFGYREVPVAEKASLVAEVFHSVANKYDVMNDLMSVGLHRYWKAVTVQEANVRSGQSVLDVAAGTGDLSIAFAKKVGKTGKVLMTDINASMLARGKARLVDAGIVGNVEYREADAENLPFAESTFDCVTIAFGLRNVTDKAAALRSMYRVLKPGGKLLILEFSTPIFSILKKGYDFYSMHVIPKIGEMVAKDKASYQYLVESIRRHPDQATLKNMMIDAAFEEVSYRNLSGGIVALHKGYKY